MSRRRDEWIERIKDVEREYRVVRVATDELTESARTDPHLLTGDLRYRDVVRAGSGLDGTYLIRLFSEFETAVRSFYATLRDTHPRCKDLLDAVANKRGVPNELLDSVHGVREYRNHLVHERDDEVDAWPLSAARSALCKWIARLPEGW